ncbi:MAG: response regulator [Fibrobacter sp.]|nr:response regulator [Fibrobacter sp.]
MIDNDESLLQEYLSESLEHLEGIEDSILKIEEDGSNTDDELVNKVFRAVHTIKGGAGFLNLQNISVVCHAQESILNLVRNGVIVPDSEITNALLVSIDTVQLMLEDISTEASTDVSSELETLNNILKKYSSETSAMDGNMTDISTGSLVALISSDVLEDFTKRGSWVYQFTFNVKKPKQYGYDNFESLISVLDKTGTILASNSPEFQDAPDGIWELAYATILEPALLYQMLKLSAEEVIIIVNQDKLSESQSAEPAAQPVATKVEKQVVSKSDTQASPIGDASVSVITNSPEASEKIRVNLSVLDKLMTLAGELVLARNQLVQSVASKNLETIESNSRQLNFITSELQMAIMATRMQPIGNVFSRFRRIVRDMSQRLGKKVNLEITGEDVELDRSIIDAIGDPLTHIVRNSMDHGVEVPHIREAAGKNGTAQISLKARHEAGMVVIEIVDDGAGIDPAKITEKAIEKKLIAASDVERLSEKEVLNLIFAPGFSTAAEVTDISGRGVGMDVVRTSFARLGGSVDISSTLGQGTTLQVRLPLTLAIIPALMVQVGAQVFAIPQVNLQELVRIAPDQIKRRINKVGDSVFLRLREELIPLLSLNEILEIKSTFVHPETGAVQESQREQFWDRRQLDDVDLNDDNRKQEQDRRNRLSGSIKIAVVTTGSASFGVVVDGFQDTEEVVLKPLGSHLQKCRFYSGATILGDGNPALIFDVGGMAEKWLDLQAVDEVRESIIQNDIQADNEKQSLILMKGGGNQYYGAPLGLITRIEEVAASEIEKVADKLHIHYRNEILQLFTLDNVAGVEPLAEQSTYNIVVFEVQNKSVGLIVSEIIDAVETDAYIDQEAYSQPGIMGSSIIEGRTTFILDLYGIAIKKMPELAVQSKALGQDEGSEEKLVLVVDDSIFFRTQIQKFVEEAGYKAVVADDGATAWPLMEEHNFTLVLTDIEMPIMDGLEFTRLIKGHEKFKNIPVVAITSLMGSEAEERGYQAGVDQYLVKLDREQIVNTLNHYHSVGVK